MAHAQKPEFVFRRNGRVHLNRWGRQFSRLLTAEVRISSSNAGYTMFRGSVKSTGYPFHSPVSPSIPLPCVTVCHHISTGLYQVMSCHTVHYICVHLQLSLSVHFIISHHLYSFSVPRYISRCSDSLRSERSGDRIPVEVRISAPVQSSPGAHPASCTMGTGSFPGANQPWHGADHPPLLAPRLKKEHSYISTPPLCLRGLLQGVLYTFNYPCNNGI
jgi:hypothetical protein